MKPENNSDDDWTSAGESYKPMLTSSSAAGGLGSCLALRSRGEASTAPCIGRKLGEGGAVGTFEVGCVHSQLVGSMVCGNMLSIA